MTTTNNNFKVKNGLDAAGDVSTTGNLSTGSSLPLSTARLSVTAAASSIGAIIRANATTPGNLEQWQNSSGTVLGGVTGIAQIYTGSTNTLIGDTALPTISSVSGAYTSATVAVFSYSSSTQLVSVGQRVTILGMSGGTYNGTWTVTSVATVSGGLAYSFTVVGSGFTNVAGTGGTATFSPTISIISPLGATSNIILQTSSNQTADILQIQNSSGTTISRISSVGSVILKNQSTTAKSAPLYFTTANNVMSAAEVGALEMDGQVFYATNGNSHRMIDIKTSQYVSASARTLDFSTATTAQSWLGSSTMGLTISTLCTYEFELYLAYQYTYVSDSTTTISHNITLSYVGGTPTTSVTQYLDYGSNTTGFTTATTMSSIMNSSTSATIVGAAISSGSRYGIVKAKGIIRGTLGGAVKVYPSISTSAITTNTITIQPNSFFKLTPISPTGATTTMNGAWA